MSKFKGKYHREHCYSRFTKDLVRRSRSRCELCGQGNHRLSIMELEPLTPEPSPENSLFLCDSCIKQINDPKKMNPHHWRFLSKTIWSDLPALQVLSIRILRRLVLKKEVWATELLDSVVIEEKILDWSAQAE